MITESRLFLKPICTATGQNGLLYLITALAPSMIFRILLSWNQKQRRKMKRMKRYLLPLAIIAMLSQNLLFAQKFQSLARTPPMGWNSWNKFGCDISEKIIRDVADSMVTTGLRDAGYSYLVIDDCWQVARDSNGTIVADPQRFPSGMKSLGDYIHSKGLKFGIYSDAGTATCQGRPGSRGYEFQDASPFE
jgi:alpha-galactosidase